MQHASKRWPVLHPAKGVEVALETLVVTVEVVVEETPAAEVGQPHWWWWI